MVQVQALVPKVQWRPGAPQGGSAAQRGLPARPPSPAKGQSQVPAERTVGLRVARRLRRRARPLNKLRGPHGLRPHSSRCFLVEATPKQQPEQRPGHRPSRRRNDMGRRGGSRQRGSSEASGPVPRYTGKWAQRRFSIIIISSSIIISIPWARIFTAHLEESKPHRRPGHWDAHAVQVHRPPPLPVPAIGLRESGAQQPGLEGFPYHLNRGPRVALADPRPPRDPKPLCAVAKFCAAAPAARTAAFSARFGANTPWAVDFFRPHRTSVVEGGERFTANFVSRCLPCPKLRLKGLQVGDASPPILLPGCPNEEAAVVRLAVPRVDGKQDERAQDE
mmetsp:Transcript_10049/g.23164  ORF Transcript_10049/g.23164 Transcript_10049/m.23164 type:complete len:334 (+) Transcript_10049:324-1325(+)